MNILMRYKNGVLAIGIIILAAVFLQKIYLHYDSEIKRLEKEEQKIEEVKRTIQQWQAVNSQYVDIKESFLKKDTLLVKKFIEERAKVADVDLPSLTLSRSEKDFYWEVVARVQGVCDYKNLVKFIDSLADKKISVIGGTLTSAGTEVTVNLQLKGVVIK